MLGVEAKDIRKNQGFPRGGRNNEGFLRDTSKKNKDFLRIIGTDPGNSSGLVVRYYLPAGPTSATT